MAEMPRANSGSGKKPAVGPIITLLCAAREYSSTSSIELFSRVDAVIMTLLQPSRICWSALTRKFSCRLWNCGFFSMTVSLIPSFPEPLYQGGEITHHADVVGSGDIQNSH